MESKILACLICKILILTEIDKNRLFMMAFLQGMVKILLMESQCNIIFFQTRLSMVFDMMAASVIYYNLFMAKTIKKTVPPPTAPKAKQPRVSFVRQSTPTPSHAVPEDPIYYEEDDASRAARPKQLRLKPKLQPVSPPLPEVKKEEEDFLPDFSQDSDYSMEFPVDRRKHPDTPILSARDFSEVSEIDFKIFADSAGRTKVFSVMLVDSFGRVVFSDKLGHELFQGSLNNFSNLRIQNLLLRTLKTAFLTQLRGIQEFNERTTVNWIIYSKNTKRRYSRIPFNCDNAQDAYYRFLKALTVRIRPIRIKLPDYASIEGFWNPQLVSPTEKEYFMLEARLCSKMPSLNFHSMLSDPVLAKYIRSNAKKARECAREGYTERTQQRRKRVRQPPVEPNDDYGASSDSPSSRNFSHVSFSEPIFGRECKFEEPMVEEEEERQAIVKEEARGDDDNGVGLFAEICIDDI